MKLRDWVPWKRRPLTPEQIDRRIFAGSDRDAILCITCSIFHHLPHDVRQAMASLSTFASKHEGHDLKFAPLYLDEVMLRRLDVATAWKGNADVKLSFATEVAFTVTNLHSLASSATAGWQGAVVDNTSNLYLDELVQAVLDFANTAPANSKGVYFFAYHGNNGTTYTNPASGSEATITLVDVTANPQAMPNLGFLPYTTQNEVAPSKMMSVAATIESRILPPKWGPVAMNHSGAALAASGNTVKHTPVYVTVI